MIAIMFMCIYMYLSSVCVLYGMENYYSFFIYERVKGLPVYRKCINFQGVLIFMDFMGH